jgi:hypothetical protein
MAQLGWGGWNYVNDQAAHTTKLESGGLVRKGKPTAQEFRQNLRKQNL